MTTGIRVRPERMSMETEAVRRVVGLVASRPGISTAQLCDALGIKLGWAKNVLSFAGRNGLVGSVRNSRRATWHPAEQARRLNAEIEAERVRLHASLAAQAAARKAARCKESMPDRPVQVWLPADVPLPFICAARNSVFALAADR